MTCVRLIAALVLMAGYTVFDPADAKVIRLDIASRQSYGTFKPGEFVFWEGRVFGELQPTEQIPDLDKAPRNATGRSSIRQKFL